MMLSRRRFFVGAAAVTAAVSMPLAKAIFPKETIEELLARKMAAAHEAAVESLSQAFYADGSQPIRGGLMELIGPINPNELVPDDWDDDEPTPENATYVRYSWRSVTAELPKRTQTTA